MENLTFGEQVKIILGRKNMTIKELAEIIEKRTGKKMSRQNLTQRLGRDNFQEQDMRMIASILECPFYLSILPTEQQTASTATEETESTEQPPSKETVSDVPQEVDMTIGDLYQIHKDLTALEEKKEEKKSHRRSGGGIFLRRNGVVPEELRGEIKEEPILEEQDNVEKKQVAEDKPKESKKHIEETGEPDDFQPVVQHHDLEEDRELGDVNPYTRREYQTNSVRMHPTRIGYVQVYDRKTHSWTDMTEWAFLGYQERKKQALGKDYEPPIYLD